MHGVVSYERNDGPAVVTVQDVGLVPDLVGALAVVGVRITKVAPHEPTLEELYFAVRDAGRAPSAPGVGSRFSPVMA